MRIKKKTSLAWYTQFTQNLHKILYLLVKIEWWLPESGKKCPLLPLLFNNILTILNSVVRQKKKWNELERRNHDYLFFVTYRLDDSLENYLKSMGKIQPS